MKLLRITILGAVVGISISAEAQVTAQAYFDQAGKEFVKQDKMQALRTLDDALRQYPNDPKLLKLAEELLKEDEQKDKQKQEQEQKEQDKQEQEKKEQEKQEQQQSDGQKEKEQQKEQQEKQEQEKEQKEQEQAQQGDQDKKEQEPKPGTIAPQDAMRMLDALERSEKDVQEKLRARRRPARSRTIENDW